MKIKFFDTFIYNNLQYCNFSIKLIYDLLFYGDEEFNISNEIKKLKSSLDANFIEMSYKIF